MHTSCKRIYWVRGSIDIAFLTHDSGDPDVPISCHRCQETGISEPRISRTYKERAIMLSRRALLISVSVLALTGPAHAAPIPVMLYKSPDCGCCEGYADYLRQNGFAVTVNATNDFSEISRKAGIPTDLQGCHTAVIGAYVVDGHVPVEAIRMLLAERPAIKAITLPGMPEGSPGMTGDKTGPFTIYAIGKDGTSGVFMKV
jgi:hypothetical protein